MRLLAAKRAMDAHTRQMEALRIFSEMTLPGIDQEESRVKAQQAQRRFEATVKPWLRDVLKERQGDDLDLVASWYIMYQPERLKQLGVDFGQIEPISKR